MSVVCVAIAMEGKLFGLLFVGGIVVFVVSLLGLGSLLSWQFGKTQPPVLE